MRADGPCHALQVLLVEDNPADVRWALEEFKDYGVCHSIVVAANGETAVDYLEGATNPVPEIILLDLNLPRLSGVEVLERIKHNALLSQIPVVVLSGSTLERAQLAARFDLPPTSYLLKPLRWPCLAEAMEGYGMESESFCAGPIANQS